MILAIDFDGTLCENIWPGIGAAKVAVIRELIERQKNGDKLILWTCRSGRQLEEALDFCRGYGLNFDAVNDDLPEIKARLGCDSRKVYADEYWDDKAVLPVSPSCDNCALRRNSTKREKSIYSWCANTCKNYRAKV